MNGLGKLIEHLFFFELFFAFLLFLPLLFVILECFELLGGFGKSLACSVDFSFTLLDHTLLSLDRTLLSLLLLFEAFKIGLC